MRAVTLSVFFFVIFSLYGLESLEFYLDEAERIEESVENLNIKYVNLASYDPPEKAGGPGGGLSYFPQNSRFFSIVYTAQLGNRLNRYYQIKEDYFVESITKRFDKPLTWGGEVVERVKEYYIVNHDKAFRYLDGNWIEDEELYYMIETLKRAEKVAQGKK